MADGSREKFSQLVFYALIILIGYLTYMVISPFLAPLAWATVFAVMFYRVHQELAPRILAALASEALSQSDVARACGRAPSDGSVRRVLAKLSERGEVQVRDGLYEALPELPVPRGSGNLAIDNSASDQEFSRWERRATLPVPASGDAGS